MGKFKRIKDNPVYYSDTDSVFLKNPLDVNLISNKIGEFKQESIVDKAVFVSPKTYAYKDDKGKSVVKGFNSKDISYNELESLLIKDNIIIKTSNQFVTKALTIKLTPLNKTLRNTIHLKRVPIYLNNIQTETKSIKLNSKDSYEEHNNIKEISDENNKELNNILIFKIQSIFIIIIYLSNMSKIFTLLEEFNNIN